MRCRSWLYVSVLVLAAGACSSSSPPSSDPGPTVDEDAPAPAIDANVADDPAIQFAVDEAAADSESFADTFGLLGQRDLIAVFDVPDHAGVQIVRMDLINPQGALHQTIWRAISSDEDAPEKVMHPEYDQPLTVIPVVPTDGQVRMHIAIPIAGTVFTRFRLTGTFTAKAWVGMGHDAPLATGQFTMTR
ncbi:MAG TPA: hypothetical protein VFG83_19430 [Kofleriaceae bacterium]|nr:hypothetical protein [Kofleriaceae bacterium]